MYLSSSESKESSDCEEGSNVDGAIVGDFDVVVGIAVTVGSFVVGTTVGSVVGLSVGANVGYVVGPLVVGSGEGGAVGRFVGRGEMVGGSVSRCFPASVVPTSKSNNERNVHVKDGLLISCLFFLFPMLVLLSRHPVESSTRIVVFNLRISRLIGSFTTINAHPDLLAISAENTLNEACFSQNNKCCGSVK